MKTSILIACLIIYGHNISMKAQSSNLPVTERPPKSTITLISPPDTIVGAIYELKDNSILVSSSLVKEDYYSGNYEVAEINIDNIGLIKPKRRIGQSVLIGAAIGAVVGAVVPRIALGPHPFPPGSFVPPEVGYPVSISAGAAAGGLIGAYISTIRLSIPINGSMENYNRQKKKLGKYTVQYPGAPTY